MIRAARFFAAVTAAALLAWATPAAAQDPTGSIEGTVSDSSSAAVPNARVTARHLDTGFTREVVSGADGFYRLLLLPVGAYRVTVDASGFASLIQEPVQVNVSQTLRINPQLAPSSVKEAVTVSGTAQLVDTSSNVLGRVVTGREIVDLPLNGRNFTQLGLLQTGVAPLTAGVATAGGSLRQGQAYAVNGGTGGATTAVVTRSGGNQRHGSLYEFLRNDAFDARNFFSREVEPLDQHQFGGTQGGPIQSNRLFFFGYYEGFRNEQGFTTTATVPTPAERDGDFSGLGRPLLNLAAGGSQFLGDRLPAAAINPIARNVVNLYPLGNVSPSLYRETLVGEQKLNQAGARVDFAASSNDQIFARYSYSGGHNLNPVSVRGTDLPGYPTRDDLATHAVLASATRVLSPTMTHAVRAQILPRLVF